MKISEVIEEIKAYHDGKTSDGSSIDAAKTRDQILFGNQEQECTGIITCIYASIDVIRQTQQKGSNLIICHEALFWNHGDHTDFLIDDEIYLEKKKMLEDSSIVIWRNHDYVHSGIPLNDGTYIDGIFYGLAKQLGWTSYMVPHDPMLYELPLIKVETLAEHIRDCCSYRGIRVIGNRHAEISKVWIPGHILGRDEDKLSKIANEDIECLLSYELVDFTVAEYIKDAGQLGKKKAIILLGHFNGEEPGMNYMAAYLADLFQELPVEFISIKDMYEYIA